jgi:hypothetical protein
MTRASDPPMKSRRSGFIERGAVVRSLSLILIGVLRLYIDIETCDRHFLGR